VSQAHSKRLVSKAELGQVQALQLPHEAQGLKVHAALAGTVNGQGVQRRELA
jgi:hypothetical protein